MESQKIRLISQGGGTQVKLSLENYYIVFELSSI
jgi:hypothetical protein